MPSQQTGFILFLALLFVLVIPIVTTRSGRSMFSAFRRKRSGDGLLTPQAPEAQPYRANGNRGELLDFLAALLKTARRNGMQVVCPGLFECDGQEARFSALVVGRGGVVGVYCLGFGGRVDTRGATWQQTLNGETRTIPNAFATCEAWQALGRHLLDGLGLQGVPFTAAAVFTNPGVELDMAPNTVCTTREEFLARLPHSQPDRGVDIDAVAHKLAAATKKETGRERRARNRAARQQQRS